MKQKRQVAILIALVVVAAGIWWWYFRGDKPVVTADIGGSAQYKPLPVEDPRPRTGEIKSARNTEYKSVGGRNIFSPKIEPPPPSKEQIKKAAEAAAQAQQAQAAIPPPPPPPPTLPVKYFGNGTVPNGTVKLAFLTNGEEVFIVHEGEVFQNRFRILKIGNTSLDFEQLSDGRLGTAQLEEQASPAGGGQLQGLPGAPQ